MTEETTYSSDNARAQGRLAYGFVKRAFDIVFSSAVICVGLIPGAVLGVAVWRDTGGSPIYAQQRVGKNGKTFNMYKFRTMVADADDVQKHLTPKQIDQWKRMRKVDDDPRITKLGHVLRKTSVDEFPQFVNSLLGQMSVIGPRAITQGELCWFGDDVDELLSIRPGITGLWQTSLRDECDYESGKRQATELEYVRTANFALDVKVFFRTFKAMASGTGR